MPATALRFIVVTPRAIARASRIVSSGAFDWCYFGQDRARCDRAAKALSAAAPVPVGEELTRVAYELKQPVLDWIAEIGCRQSRPAAWWGSTLASCSPLRTDFFLLVCYAELVASWLRQPASHRPRVVVVEDPWLARLLQQRYAEDARLITPGCGALGCLADAAGWMVKGVFARIYTLLWAAKSLALTKRAFRPHRASGSRRLTLIYTWVGPHSISADGELADPWTGRLKRLLTARGAEVKFLTSLVMPSRMVIPLQKFGDDLVVTPAHLRWPDVARAVCGWFRLEQVKLIRWFRGGDYALLLRRETLQERGRSDFLHYRLLYAAMRRVASAHGAMTACMIYPFENQPWEKLFCLAWRECAPAVRLIGYQHTWVPPLLLPYALGAGEQARVPLPDWIVVNSEFNLRVLKEGGFPEALLVNAGALRHEYLHAPPAARPPAAASPQWRTVVVAFPQLAAPSSHLLADLIEQFREPLILDALDRRPVRFLLKFHPSLPAWKLWHGRLRLPDWMELSKEPMSRVLPEANLLLYASPTSSWWEARFSGVPVLKYQPDLLDMDAGQAAFEAPVPVCNRSTLRSSITAMMSRPQERMADEGALKRLFGPVDEARWFDLVQGMAGGTALSSAPPMVEAG